MQQAARVIPSGVIPALTFAGVNLVYFAATGALSREFERRRAAGRA